MKFHIVRNKETLDDILYIYNLTKDELKEQNKHIRVWDKLIPGTKLKIPPIPKSVELEMADIEPFVEDYYPTMAEDTTSPIPIVVEGEYKPIDDEQTKQIVEEPIVDEKSPQSSKIYEDYENKKDVNVEIKEVKEENKKIEINTILKPIEPNTIQNNKLNPNPYSALQGQYLYNNYYPYYLNAYNAPRYITYPIIYYPVYYPKGPKK